MNASIQGVSLVRARENAKGENMLGEDEILALEERKSHSLENGNLQKRPPFQIPAGLTLRLLPGGEGRGSSWPR